MKFNAREPQGQTQGSKSFLRLKDKDSVVGVFRGEIATFHQLWTDGKSQIVDDTVAGGKFRFRINFVCKDESGKVVSKLWDGGWIVYKQLSELHKEYDLESIFVKITRNGSGTDTTYTLMPMLKQKVDPDIKGVPLQELFKVVAKQSSPDAPDFMDIPDPSFDDDMPPF